MFRKLFPIIVGVSFAALFHAAPASAQRTIAFDAYEVPASGTVAVPLRVGGQAEGAFAQVDAATSGALSRALTATGYRGRSNTQLDLPAIAPYDRILVVGIGDEPVSRTTLEDFGGLVARFGKGSSAARIDVLWDGDDSNAASYVALGAELGQYSFDIYKTGSDDESTGDGTLVIRTPAGSAAAQAWQSGWKPVADGVRFARDLSSEPANALWPEEFVARTRAAFAGVPNVSIEVLDVPAMQRLGMGGMLSVGQGSVRPPRLLLVRYNGGGRGEAPVALVGKGITFDSGGISLKPNAGMWQMKADMTGAAVVTGAVLGLAQRRAPVNVVAVAALAENMPSGSAARPGDVVRTAAGTTFEITSTDAEGRMVLTDALWYVQREDDPATIIDVATLTGAVMTALGDDYAGLFSRHDDLADRIFRAGEGTGELVWRLPLHPTYETDIRSQIADYRHSGGSGAGAGIGAHFIGIWVDEGRPWAHLDIAGKDWNESNHSPTVPAGASAFGVRLLDLYIRENHE